MENMKASRSLHSCSKDLKNVREVLGMKLFLEDFTLANERHATEVALWKDYLVFAELFGIAKQVRKDMKQINPEYLKMDEIYASAERQRRAAHRSYGGCMLGHVPRGVQNSGGQPGGGWWASWRRRRLLGRRLGWRCQIR